MRLQQRAAAIPMAWRQLPSLHKALVIAAVVLFSFVALMRSDTVDVVHDRWDRITQAGLKVGLKAEGPIAGGIPIRIMFIGASVTLGDRSTGEVGYRKQIRDWIVSRGNRVNAVGANRYGDFEDNDVQAFGAQPIKPTLDRAREIVPATQPNLILVNAGSSDCFQEDNWGAGHVYRDMHDLIEFLLLESPRATIVMSTIVTCPWAGTEQCVKGANAQIRQVATDLIREGKPIALAEMHFDQGLPNRPNLTDIGPDDMHPTDRGYFLMGDIFMEKVREVDRKGWLQPPVQNGVPADGDTERVGKNTETVGEEAGGKGPESPEVLEVPDGTSTRKRHGAVHSGWRRSEVVI
ncbi:Uu.00g111370.m01.CDS01 [Anthostomella pinea]|uniref:Uu.00g111370.m01.CDS01 n=1 Tax=Anthostomella pinea TaxID=933095 RepID=A0AAI8VG50_9PEZI|nr:Uu.00g111370.m01.CDS01 [Anthostomella pinea]